MTILKRDFQVCWNILPGVSRSFAHCIELLPKPVDSSVMISYLIFRTIDTIEDSSSTYELKEECLKRLEAILVRDLYVHETVLKLKNDMIPRIKHTYEHQLLKDVDRMLRCYFSFDPSVRRVIRKWAVNMADGMLRHQTIEINSFQNQDQYCYYAAGIVGYLLTDLFYVQKKIDKRCYHRLYPLSEKFGLALQKVNIIRDVSYDVALKRFYWPKRLLEKYHLAYETLCCPENRSQSLQVLLRMIENARKCLDYAVAYIKLLPRRQLRLRVFCLIPMFMAIYSLQKCIDNENVFIPGKKVKISRQLVREITVKSYAYGWSNLLIAKWYKRAMIGFSPLESLPVKAA